MKIIRDLLLRIMMIYIIYKLMQDNHFGLLSQETTNYLKKRLSLLFNYLVKSKLKTFKFKSKYHLGWGR